VEVYRLYHTLPGVAVARRTVDEETRAEVTVTTQLVAASTAAPAPTPGTQIEFQPLNSVYGNRITTVINGGNSAGLARTEWRYVEFQFPALLHGIAGVALTGRDGTARVSLNSNLRPAFSRLVLARVDITYGALGSLHSESGGPALFQPRLNNLLYNGIAFSINERNVLNDRIPATGFLEYVSVSNPKWPNFIETYYAEPSTPSLADYQALVTAGTYVPISATIRPWRLGLERLEIVNIKLQ